MLTDGMQGPGPGSIAGERGRNERENARFCVCVRALYDEWLRPMHSESESNLNLKGDRGYMDVTVLSFDSDSCLPNILGPSLSKLSESLICKVKRESTYRV